MCELYRDPPAPTAAAGSRGKTLGDQGMGFIEPSEYSTRMNPESADRRRFRLHPTKFPADMQLK